MIPLGAYRTANSGDPYWDNVVLLCPMDGSDDGTSFPDVSGYAHEITRYNAVTKTGTKVFGTASAFIGSISALSVENHPVFDLADNDFTIECWVYFSTTASATILSQRISATENHSFTFAYIAAAGRWQLQYTTDGSTAVNINGFTSSIPAQFTWYHIALVRSGTTLSLYIDGVKQTDKTISSTIYSSSAPLTIGAAQTASTPTYTQRVTGYIDDLRITVGQARTIVLPTAAYPIGY